MPQFAVDRSECCRRPPLIYGNCGLTAFTRPRGEKDFVHRVDRTRLKLKCHRRCPSAVHLHPSARPRISREHAADHAFADRPRHSCQLMDDAPAPRVVAIADQGQYGLGAPAGQHQLRPTQSGMGAVLALAQGGSAGVQAQ